MTFNATLPAGSFAEVVRRCAGITPGVRGTIPVLSHVLLRASNGGLEVAATNMDQTLAVALDADAAGAVTASAIKLAEIGARLEPNEPVSFGTDGVLLIVSQGRTRYKLPTLPADDWPVNLIDPQNSAVEWEAPADQLSEGLSACDGAISKNDASRPYLIGAYFDFTDGDPRIFATNGHCLASIATTDLRPPPGASGIIYPQQAFAPLSDLAKRHNMLTIAMAASGVTLRAGREQFRTKLLAGTYPDVRLLIPAARATKILVNTAALRKAVDRAAIIEGDPEGKRGGYTTLHIEMAQDELAITTRNSNGETAESACPYERLDGPQTTVHINADYVAWAVSTLSDAEALELAIEDSQSPILITRAGDAARADLRLVMPCSG